MKVFLLIFLITVQAIFPVIQGPHEETLTWSIEGITDLESLDPARAADSQALTVMGLLYSGLVKLDAQLNVTSDLAERWTVSDDGLVYTFSLRNDAKFSDGSPVTADDVVASLTHALDPSTGGWVGPFYLSNILGADELIAGSTRVLNGVRAINEYTVEARIKQPSAFFLSQLTFAAAKIISAHDLLDSNTLETSLRSSGPFMLQSWNRGRNIELVPNPHYWQTIHIDRLSMPFIAESESAYLRYRAGELDVMGSQQNGVPLAYLHEVRLRPDFRQAASFAVRYIGFNNITLPFHDVRVRQAFAMSVDRDLLISGILSDTASATYRILPPGIPGSELEVSGISYDAERARAVLADAGVDADTIGPVTLTYGLEGDNEQVVRMLQSMWRENLGIEVTLEGLPVSDFSTRLNETTNSPETGLQMYYSIWGADYPDPQNFLSQQLRSGAGNNNGHWSNERFDAFVDEADVITDNPLRRFALYNQAEQIAIDEVGWLPIFNPKLNVLIKPYVLGMVFSGQGITIPDYAALRGRQ